MASLPFRHRVFSAAGRRSWQSRAIDSACVASNDFFTAASSGLPGPPHKLLVGECLGENGDRSHFQSNDAGDKPFACNFFTDARMTNARHQPQESNSTFENFAVLQHAAHPVDNIRLLGLLGTKNFWRCILGCREMCRLLVFTDFVTVPQRDGKKKHKKRGAGKKRELLFVGTASGSLKAYDAVLGELRWNVTNCCEGCVLVLFITFQTAIHCLLNIKNGLSCWDAIVAASCCDGKPHDEPQSVSTRFSEQLLLAWSC